MNSPCNCRCSWCDATQLAKVTENPSGRARLRQLLRKMPPASRLVALGRIDEQLYGQCFEAEFGRLPQHWADAEHVEDVTSDDAELEKDVGVGHADLEDAHPPADGSAFQETQARGMNTDQIRGECGRGESWHEAEQLPDNSDSSDSHSQGPSPQPASPRARPKPVPSQAKAAAKARQPRPHKFCRGFDLRACRAPSPHWLQEGELQFNLAVDNCAVCSALQQPSALRLHLHARRSLTC